MYASEEYLPIVLRAAQSLFVLIVCCVSCVRPGGVSTKKYIPKQNQKKTSVLYLPSENNSLYLTIYVFLLASRDFFSVQQKDPLSLVNTCANFINTKTYKFKKFSNNYKKRVWKQFRYDLYADRIWTRQIEA